MEVCRACGAFLMDGWDRCKICGHDPHAVLDRPPEPPTSPRKAKKTRQGKQAQEAKPATPATRPGPPPPGPARPAGPRMDRAGSPILVAAVVVAVLAAGYFLWYRPNHEEPAATTAGAAVDTTTSTSALTSAAPAPPSSEPVATTAAPAGGLPGSTRDDFAAAIGAIGAESFPLPGDAWPCAGRLVVDALGGADVLTGQGLSPADFTARTAAGRLVVPDGAIDLIGASIAGCGIDMRDLVVRQLAASNPATVVNCIAAGLDRTLGNQALATQLVTGAEAMVSGTAYYDHVVAVAIGCGG